VIFDATIDADTHYGPENNYGFTDYGLALMLKWHRQDPVSQKEVDRNNGIQKTQGNRNPFIDYPYLAEFIWGEMSGQVLDFDQLLCSADELFELGVSKGYLGEVQGMQLDTIFWMVGDTQYDCTYHHHGTKMKNLPEAPSSCSATSTTFMGWTNAPIADVSADAPIVLYTKAADFPAINTNTAYYAVFAQVTTSEIIGQTITLNKADSTDWTLTNLKQKSNKTDGAYWLLVKDASITSPVIDLQTLDSIAMNIRSYQSKTTVSISVNGNLLGTLSAETNSIQRYVWSAPELTGSQSVTFTGINGTASYGVGINAISLYLGGAKATYTNYLTHCDDGPATLLTTPNVNNSIRKIIRNGQLLIIHNGQIYNTLGNNIEQF
jgi:hypothetical protein